MAKSRVTKDDAGTDGAAATPKKRGASAARVGARRKRGRTIFAVVLIMFVIVLSAVIWRRSYGITLSRSLAQLDRQRVQLESERARWEAMIRDGSGRAKLTPMLDGMGMRVPNDQQVRILPR